LTYTAYNDELSYKLKILKLHTLYSHKFRLFEHYIITVIILCALLLPKRVTEGKRIIYYIES